MSLNPPRKCTTRELEAYFSELVEVMVELLPDNNDETLRQIPVNLNLAHIRVIANALAFRLSPESKGYYHQYD